MSLATTGRTAVFSSLNLPSRHSIQFQLGSREGSGAYCEHGGESVPSGSGGSSGHVPERRVFHSSDLTARILH